jgi:hypothetical protein
LSVADRGRGGFDSHTFPPVVLPVLAGLALLAGWLAVGAPEARAQAPGDSSAVVTKAPPARNANGELVRPWHEQPWSIMARSAILPGWGQFKNGRPLKGALAIAIEGVAAARVVSAGRDVDDALARESNALAEGDEAAAAAARADYDAAFNRRAAAGWVLGIGIVLSMVDAYVDAHLLQFDADFGPDPALPDDATGIRTGSYQTRASLRWSFTGP